MVKTADVRPAKSVLDTLVAKARKVPMDPSIPWKPAKCLSSSQWSATTTVAAGPVVERAVVAGSNDCWFELFPAANSAIKNMRFDRSDVCFIVQLLKARSRTGPSVIENGKVTFSPSPPVLPHRPHGSIHVLLPSLRTAGQYFLHVVRDSSDIRGSPFTVTVDPGPPSELRMLGRHRRDAVAVSALASKTGDIADTAVNKIDMCAGEPCSIIFRSYDSCGNALPTGGASVQVQLRHTTASFEAAIIDRRDGTYELTACCDVVGTYACRVALMTSQNDGADQYGGNTSHKFAHHIMLSFSVSAAAPTSATRCPLTCQPHSARRPRLHMDCSCRSVRSRVGQGALFVAKMKKATRQLHTPRRR